ncbi:MAG: phosphatidylinositol-4- kinase [Thelocarpon superellum]|nr:MAG: phosphatidylinositol-4- kinase [Thelocarpon superellum]
MERSSSDIRRIALQKIAVLSATSPSPTPSVERADLDRISRACPSRTGRPNGPAGGISRASRSVSKVPMGLRELEALLALCKAAPLLPTIEQAKRLLEQLSPYLLESHVQTFAPSPYLRDIDPSPWEALTFALASALLAIGLNHPSLRESVQNKVTYFLEQCLLTVTSLPSRRAREEGPEDADGGEVMPVAPLTLSLLGFLDAASSHANFWSTPEKLQAIQQVKRILSENFLVAIETAFSTVRNSHGPHPLLRDWRRYARDYAAVGRPLGAMLLQRGFMRFIVSCTSLLVAPPALLRGTDVLDVLMATSEPKASNGNPASDELNEVDEAAIDALTDILFDEMSLLEDGADFLQLGSAWQQRLAFAVKAYVVTAFVNCVRLDQSVADADLLMTWLEDTMADPVQMSDDTLASAVLKCTAILAALSPAFASKSSRSLPRFIVQGGARGPTVAVAATCLATVLQRLSQDAIITTLYTLGNVLSAGATGDKAANGLATPTGPTTPTAHRLSTQNPDPNTGSAISLAMHGEEETSVVHDNVIQAIVGIATRCKDDKITALAQSMLVQKVGKISPAVDARIIAEAAALGVAGGPQELRAILRLYARLSHDSASRENPVFISAVLGARTYLSTTLTQESPLRELYLVHLLETIIGIGDVHEGEHTREVDVELAAREIAQLLRPLALLLSSGEVRGHTDAPRGDAILALHRDAWFNVVVHGFTTSSELGRKHRGDLQQIAIRSPPLIAEHGTDLLESDVELNTVLRRGMNPQHTVEEKRALAALLPNQEADVRGLSYSKIMFLRAASFLESLRADAGDCTKVLAYFQDPILRVGEMANVMTGISDEVMDIYVRKARRGTDTRFAAPRVAEQLAQIFAGCCHRVVKVQTVAAMCAERIVRDTPSALCQRSSIFALLELLSIMWRSCLEAETDEYAWKSTFTSTRGKVTVELSDDYALRRRTLNALSKRARGWMMKVMNIAPLNVKGLLQTYLSDYDDNGAYGHVSLGRSVALDLGSTVPTADQRLGAIDRHGDVMLNTASDFMAQYTTRQEYRFADPLPDHDQDWVRFMHLENPTVTLPATAGPEEDATTILAHLEARTADHKFVSIGELRDVLRRAAALLCRSKKDQCAIVHHLVGIPFVVFTKQSINLGVSLWMGIINENPRMGTRILMEIAEQWEGSVRKKMGIFNDRFRHPDPFYLKGEFAPSDKDALLKRQQMALNVIGPHLRILQFLASHYHATRLGSPHVEKIFLRLVHVTLDGLMHATTHPLAREIRLQIVLLGLTVLRHGTSLDGKAQYRLKDRILSAALTWFAAFPRWSFGGNRLQIKAEAHLLADVATALHDVASLGSSPPMAARSPKAKEDLLLMLLDNEQTRLMVWLYPLDHERRMPFTASANSKVPTDAALSAVLATAWAEQPALALALVQRFRTAKLVHEVRWLLLNHPQQAIGEPEALEILLGPGLPPDLSFQLKYLLYWAPVNPITAVTYFLPAYGNQPFVVQYAMRALESHSVDVTFFYVPQIVQTLRYDALGYVERYIIETAKFSQLFAHQIIWNMKANAYKDEDSQVPDAVKPKLDQVTGSLLSSFSVVDRAFYEREFGFFNEITDISGKLRPYIRRPKPEKKQKIEEELRKIKVEVGVYLPSNPDGVVIGIDRQSGKPLQSHAKAPYMATFRIKKARGPMEGTEHLLDEANRGTPGSTGAGADTLEVWQSAIFKVGDDCRQDVLALQLIAAFRGIFNHVGLDVYVYPYRVTATAPGCGVIDVLPNAISRDMLGREAVNGLYDYFLTKYGGPDSIRFQEARNNFVKSMAAYSVISYLLQFKDRHNGNIMVDEAGHILHIDFGFCFDIAPGGVKFERAPFKLTSEMVAVMGGSTESQSYQWFEELCIKAFLAARPYVEQLVHVVIVMLDSGLPCFKPDTIQHFRERFVLEKTEREAAEFMRDLIKKSHTNYSTNVYDQFQLLTNGIPY